MLIAHALWRSRRRPFAARTAQLVVAALGATLAAGCGRSGPEVAPVAGVVRLDGKPLPRGTIMFYPAAGRTAAGKIGPDGAFELTTFEPGDGALVGKHRVAVSAPKSDAPARPNYDAPDDARQSAANSLIPQRYADPTLSGLEFEVTSGDNSAKFDLSSK